MCKKIMFSLIIFSAIPQLAFGYIDPGTGSYIVQLIAGVVFAGGAGVLFWGKTFLKKLRHPFKKEDEVIEDEVKEDGNNE